jgi:hypothetical protein
VKETYGEDPYLVARMGIAAVRGFQGDGRFGDKRTRHRHLEAFRRARPARIGHEHYPPLVGASAGFLQLQPSARRGYLFDDVRHCNRFGYGLSYTTFAIENVRLVNKKIWVDGATRVLADVTTTGKREGTEVIQMYIRGLGELSDAPGKELKGFQRVNLQAGETKTVALDITPESLGFFDVNMKYTAEPGLFPSLVTVVETNTA